MRRSTGLIPVILLALVITLAAACNGDSEAPASGDSDARGDRTPQPLVAGSPMEVLGASVERFTQDVEAFEGEIKFEFSFEGMSMNGSGYFAFREPESFYMRMEFALDGADPEDFDSGDFGFDFDFDGAFVMEMLFADERMYMKMPFLGDDWYVMSLEDMGLTEEEIEELRNMDESAFDYEAFIEGAGGEITDLGVREVDGRSLQGYGAEIDLLDAMTSFMDGFGSDLDMPEIPADFSAPLTMEVWLDTETLLPHALTMDGTFEIEGEAMLFSMSFVITEYGGDVSIPAPPASAKSFDEAFGDLFDFDMEDWDWEWDDDFDWEWDDDFDFEAEFETMMEESGYR